MHFGAFLEHIWAWNGCHMLGAKRMDEIEDLKMMFPTWTRFPSRSRKAPKWRWNPSWIRIPSQNGFPSWIRIPWRWRFLLKQGFLLEVGKLNPNGIKLQLQRRFPSPRRKGFQDEVGEEFQVKRGLRHVFLMLEGLLSVVGHKWEVSRKFTSLPWVSCNSYQFWGFLEALSLIPTLVPHPSF